MNFVCGGDSRPSFGGTRSARRAHSTIDTPSSFLPPSGPAPPALRLREIRERALLDFYVMGKTLTLRRELTEKRILPKVREPVPYAAPLDASLPILTKSVKAQGQQQGINEAAFHFRSHHGGLVRPRASKLHRNTSRLRCRNGDNKKEKARCKEKGREA